MAQSLDRRRFVLSTAALASGVALSQSIEHAWAQWPALPKDPPNGAHARIAPFEEPGEQLVISGKVFGANCRIAVAGVTVYAYQTDANGYYRPDHHIPDWKMRRPRLEGTARTGADGAYEFQTIRPAPYPERNNPAHVHFVLWWPDGHRQSDILYFEGDPLLSSDQYRQNSARGSCSSIQRVMTEAGMHRVQVDFQRHDQEES